MAPFLALTGFMGSGKSSVGRIVAQELGWDFVDSDEAVAEEAGMSVERIFHSEGEEGFREREAAAVEKILSSREQGGVVVALGGGAVTSSPVRDLLMRSAHVFLLEVDPEVAWRRSRDSGRPLARSREEFGKLFHSRSQLYREVAQTSIATAGCSERQVAQRVRSQLERVAGQDIIGPSERNQGRSK